MKRIVIILGCILSFHLAFANEKNYFFQKISPESGFAFDAINTITEDCNGFIWFGNNNGLYYYNTSVIEKISLVPPHSTTPQSFAIHKVYLDNNCQLWVCTEFGLYRFKSSNNQFERIELLFPGATDESKPAVTDILQFNEIQFVISASGALYTFSNADSTLKEVTIGPFTGRNHISFLGKDEKGTLLVGTGDGKVFYGKDIPSGLSLLSDFGNTAVRSVCFDQNKYYIGYEGDGVDVVTLNGLKINELNENQTGKNNIASNRVRRIIKRSNGEIWIGTYQGITIITPEKNITLTNKLNNGLPNNSIYEFYQGKNSAIWVGTWSGGIAYFNDFDYNFTHIRKVPNEKNEPKSIISSFAQLQNGEILIGSEQAGISFYNRQTNEFSTRNKLFDRKELQRVKSLVNNGSDVLLIGTFDAGTWQYNHTAGTLKKIESDILTDRFIVATTAFLDNEFWFATRGWGLFKYSPGNGSIQKLDIHELKSEESSSERIWNLFFDSAHNLWICTDGGLFVKEAGSDEIRKCLRGNTEYTQGKTMIFTISEDKNGHFWIGTRGKGLFMYYPENDSIGTSLMQNMDVYSIIRDKNQDMWFTTNHGIFWYSWQTGEIKGFNSIDGLSGDQYIPNSAFLCKNGDLMFGSTNGFNIVDPGIIKSNTNEPGVFLSKILINNKPVSELDNIVANSGNVAELKTIELNYNQNSLIIGVVTDNFIKPQKNRFKYRLLNYTDEWTETGQNQDIVYTKIPPGKYTFEVYGANNDGVWSVAPYRLEISVKQQVWLRWYAKAAYLLIVIGIAVAVFKELRYRIRLRKEILAERFKSEAREMLYAEKLKFFTNISHEVRTPLTLIISPLNNLIKKFQYDEGTIKHLNIIQRNSKRLLRLTNQILDLRLIETGKLKPGFQKTELVNLAEEAYKCFELQVMEKQINFIFTSTLKSVFVHVDPDMVEKIIYNLISNALKFSPEKGQIILSIENKQITPEDFIGFVSSGNQLTGNAVEIKVRDFGKGIKKELLPIVFDRFTKDPDDKDTGTGIGLNLCQEYARLNNGNIMVSSEAGNGTTFIFSIPLNNEEIEKENIIVQFPLEKSENRAPEAEMKINTGGNRKVVLLAEDNDELRSYLKDYLSNYFKIITAKNGKQAIEIAQEIKPDVIITDILMPEKDGFEVIQTLKGSIHTSHIPVIVLTALYEGDYQIKSIIKGADAYLVKPVNESLLLAQIENILASREMIKKRIGAEKDIQNEILSAGNGSIIETAVRLIEKNLQNSDFDTIQLAKELNVSNSTLHRKIKSSTNQSPTEFIRDIRLKHAVRIMKNGKYNIDEIGAFVGFNSTSYFIRSFKKKYGKTPKEFHNSTRD